MGKKILSFLMAHIHPYGYLILLIITAMEASAFLGLFVPGDTVVVLSGFLAYKGKMKLFLVIIIATAGAVIGDNIGYAIGHRFGLPFLMKHGKRFHIKKRYIQKAEDFFKKHGAVSVILGRFVSYIRTFIPVVAGISQMDYKIFLLYNFLGGLLWASVVTFLGYLFGRSWELISHIFGLAGALIFFLAVTAIVVYLMIRRRHSAE